jgi:hypothetical protein
MAHSDTAHSHASHGHSADHSATGRGGTSLQESQHLEALDHHDDWFRHDPSEQHQDAHGDTQALGIIAFMVGTLVVVIVVSLAAYYLFESWGRKQLLVNNERRTKTAEYQSLRAEWTRQLGAYEWTDAAAGKVRIPLELARTRVIDLYSKPAPAPTPIPAAAPTSTPAPASPVSGAAPK